MLYFSVSPAKEKILRHLLKAGFHLTISDMTQSIIRQKFMLHYRQPKHVATDDRQDFGLKKNKTLAGTI